MSDITGADQFGRLIQAGTEVAAEPDVSMINGRPAEPWEAERKREAILADRARESALLPGWPR